MYLWLAVPGGESSEGFAERLLEHGVLVAPGSYLGAAGEGPGRFNVMAVPTPCLSQRCTLCRCSRMFARRFASRSRPSRSGRLANSTSTSTDRWIPSTSLRMRCG